MSHFPQYAALSGRLVILGFGSIGQGVLPLILRHITIKPEQITVLSADADGSTVAADYGVHFVQQPLDRHNYRDLLDQYLKTGDFLLNLSVNVSSVALIEYCQPRRILYLDTCVEPWAGGYTDPALSPSLRSNYALREQALALRGRREPTTAVIAHGANPGLVSHFVKQALLDIAAAADLTIDRPADRSGWAKLARMLGIKVIHVAERDTQIAATPKRIGEFVNTWSIDGFVGEGCQPAELGWGTHERHWPAQAGRHEFGCDAAIYLNRPGAATRVRSWTPLEGPYHGFLITHNEAISIADYYTVREGEQVVYRPTAHYAYHPCDAAVLSLHELAGKQWQMQPAQRLLNENDIVSGIDELGVLLMGNSQGVYWYGSRLSIDEARQLVPHNNATSLQVTVAVLAGMIWAIQNPQRSVIEADEMDSEFILNLCRPYLGPVVGVFGDWTPLQHRHQPFAEDLDDGDPWQFKNILVN